MGRSIMRFCSVRRVVLIAAVLASLPGVSSAARGPKSSLHWCRVEPPLYPAAPGDTVTITLRATRKGGLRQVHGFLGRSHYLRADGKNEWMIVLTFKPTGKPDEFGTQFVVPTFINGTKDQPLPEGPYRLCLRGGVDGKGEPFGHGYVTAGRLDFDPAAPSRGRRHGPRDDRQS